MTDFEEYTAVLDKIGARYTITDHDSYRYYAISYNKNGRDIPAVEVGKVVEHVTEGGYSGLESEAWFSDEGNFIGFAAWE